MTELDYAHNSLNDVPNEVFAFERTLEKIVLDCNNIRDLPRQLFQCEGLRILHLSDNDIHVLPPAISSLTQLYELNLSKNVLTDIPETIKQCKQLTILDLSVNPLQKIPEGCTQLLSVTDLYLNDTFLEFLPANFGRLARLKILELRENGLNTLPKSLSRLTQLERLDLGQNEISEMPEVVGSLVNLKELWMDGNRIKMIPSMIGNLTKLSHLDLSMNHIDYMHDSIQNCKSLTDLTLSTNDLAGLPEAIGGLDSLVTLKLDDNQLTEVPMSVGRLKRLEEMVLSQNYLESLPPSIGLCRKLHTLNVDDNDIEFLPQEIGSCQSLRILSVHGNRLTSLPAELDHITELAVINVTANMIQNLPVSLMKLNNLSAIWLSENQHKPLVQLNQDTDPETGQKVLTNFLLPQQNQEQDHANGGLDNISESGSFHALAWEEERAKRSQVKFGDQDVKGKDPNVGQSLRREPTPFPKEMRAMAKRVQNMRNKKSGGGHHHHGLDSVPADDLQRRKNRRNSTDNNSNSASNEDFVHHDAPVEVKEARVFKQQTEILDQNGETNAVKMPLLPLIQQHQQQVDHTPSPMTEEKELKQFEVLEQTLQDGVSASVENILAMNLASTAKPVNQSPLQQQQQQANATSPDKTSRDSGILSSSPDHGSTPDQDNNPMMIMPPTVTTNGNGGVPSSTTRNPSDPLPQAPVKAEIVTNEINDDPGKKPPPYHIAAQMSKHANDFQKLERKSSFMSDSAGSETSTAPSSLQTIIKGPTAASTMATIAKSSFSEASNSETESMYNHANNLRKVSEQMLLGNSGSARSRSSFSSKHETGSGIPLPRAKQLPSPMINNSSSSNTIKNIAGSEMRPSSYAGPQNTIGLPVMSPAAASNVLNTTLPTATSTLERPSGIRPPSQIPSKLRKASFDTAATTPPIKKSPPPVPKISSSSRPKNNGLLSTIEQAAMSDEETSMPSTPMRPPSVQGGGSRIPTPNMNQPNYENVAKISDGSNRSSPSIVGSMIPMAKKSADRLSTANFVATPTPGSSMIPTPKRSITSPSPTPSSSSATASGTPTSRIPSKIPSRK